MDSNMSPNQFGKFFKDEVYPADVQEFKANGKKSHPGVAFIKGRGVLGRANQARRNAESSALYDSMNRVGGAKIHDSNKRVSRSNDKRKAIRESMGD